MDASRGFCKRIMKNKRTMDAAIGRAISLQDTKNENAQEKMPYFLKAVLSYLHSVGAHRRKMITLSGVVRRLFDYHKISVDEEELAAQLAVAAEKGGAHYYRLNGVGEAALNRQGTYWVFRPSGMSLGNMKRDKGWYPRDLGEV